VSTGKEQYVTGDGTDARDYPVCALADLSRRFSSRGAVAEQVPAWILFQDFG
jgi:hypothetical protein